MNKCSAASVVAFRQFDDFHVVDAFARDAEAQERAHEVVAIMARRAGIKMEEMILRIAGHAQDVAMAAHQKLGWMGEEGRAERAVVVAGVSANVFEENIDLLAAKTQGFGEGHSQFAPVDIATHSAKRRNFGQSLGHFERADVARVPDFVAGRKMMGEARVESAVGVGN